MTEKRRWQSTREIEAAANQIVEVLEGCGAVLPLAVWTSSFREIGSSYIVPSQHDSHRNYYDSALGYLSITDFDGNGVNEVVEPAKIVDATGRKVYPVEG
ncbi:MAG: hypothetical protein ACD_40C00306G0001 [uncultured bacterium]|nr:MAG: hypothetical protein ACD_40C00306G0001 [uncultured bacterium]